MRLFEAIYKLNPSIVTIDGSIAYDANGNEVSFNLEEAQDLVTATAYQRQRAVEYPPIGDQLDALWKGGEAAAEMLAKVQAVKAKYPKVGE